MFAFFGCTKQNLTPKSTEVKQKQTKEKKLKQDNLKHKKTNKKQKSKKKIVVKSSLFSVNNTNLKIKISNSKLDKVKIIKKDISDD